MLTAEGISKRFNRNWALKDVSFSAREGEVLGLIGPNGAGKTTLLECLAGLLPADEGTVKIRDRVTPPARRKREMFYMPDGILPWADQIVGWALSFFEDLYAGSRAEVAELIAPLRLAEIMRARIGSLSKGERKRTLLALGLVTATDLLLLDEPFDGLDLRQTRDVMSLLKSHAASGRTLMLSIHQLVDAERVCDRLVLLSAGRVAAEGSLAELRAQSGLAEGHLEDIFLALT
ncbi:MAG TPA: ABC transporter ATP-binding protein [Blastocatellia bacterium]|nr:ABC transporter ATP-binding protein [Blastocatellia bacterium]